MENEFTSQRLAEAFAEHRARLMSLVARRLNPILLKRLSYEDVMQEVYLAAAKRLTYFAQNEDVPIYFKLRTILLQTLADIERKNLQAAGRDAYKELESCLLMSHRRFRAWTATSAMRSFAPLSQNFPQTTARSSSFATSTAWVTRNAPPRSASRRRRRPSATSAPLNACSRS